MKIKDRIPIERRWLMMQNEMNSWIAGWKDIQRFIVPTRGFFYETIPNWGRSIDHKTQLNGAPYRALRTLASGMTSGLTSPSRPWFKLGLQNHDLMEVEEVKEWLSTAEQRVYNIFSKSNIYGVFTNLYEELGGFGTAATIILEDYDTVIRARNFTAGEYALGQGPDGRVNSFSRRYWMTVGQLVKEFGKENVTPQVLNQYERGIVDPWIRVGHLIDPNDDRIEDKKDYGNKPFRSVQWEVGSPPNMALRISGFDEFPVLGPRWDTTTTAHIYGWGPGHHALGDTKMLMKMERDKLVALDKVVDPPMQQDGTVQGEANTLPGGITRTSSSVPNAGARPAYQISPDLKAIQEAINETKAAIDETFFKDMFLMLSQADDPRMTATEVAERHEEKLLILGPVIERLESEFLDPLIERTFNIAMRTRVIPPPPQILQGQPFKVEYVSTLAQAQRMVGTTAIQQVVSFVGNLAAANPQSLDMVDFDEAVRVYSEMMGIPPKIIRSEDVVQAIRAQKMKQQAAAAASQNLPAMVDGAKTLSDTRLNQNSALDALLGNQPTQGAPAPAGAPGGGQ